MPISSSFLSPDTASAHLTMVGINLRERHGLRARAHPRSSSLALGVGRSLARSRSFRNTLSLSFSLFLSFWPFSLVPSYPFIIPLLHFYPTFLPSFLPTFLPSYLPFFLLSFFFQSPNSVSFYVRSSPSFVCTFAYLFARSLVRLFIRRPITSTAIMVCPI